MDIIISVLRFIGIIFLVLMVFNVMIIVHEWGHFLAGRWRGLYIDRFQIWFGKPWLKKTVNGVQYGIGWIPAGGFVSLPQMVTMEAIEGEVPDAIKDLPPVKPIDKIIVAFAGPLFSFLLAAVFALAVWGVGRPLAEANKSTTIGYVQEESAAAKAGLQVGDTILEIDGDKIQKFRGMGNSVVWSVVSSKKEVLPFKIDRPGVGEMELSVTLPTEPESAEEEPTGMKKFFNAVFKRSPFRKIGVGPAYSALVLETYEGSPAAKAGLLPGDELISIDGEKVNGTNALIREFEQGYEADKPISVVYSRGGKESTVEITPVKPLEGTEEYISKPRTGIIFNGEGRVETVHDKPHHLIGMSFQSIVRTLGAVISPKSDVKLSHLNGPVGILGVFYDLFQEPSGWKLVLWFSVVLNVNLAVLNLMPFPVLDGGHIVMAIAEWIRRKPVPIRFLEIVQTGFVLLLLSFMAFVTLKDIGDRIPGKKPPKVEVVFPS
ncbi:MAG: RIP metalloprotease RseP [Verrucomicrobiota bacterium]